ncbi:MAG: PAS domain S-box protein [Coriobacteriia bacterium]|nr:PAS domain S-box protein [Coriobacteriia bacterium]
MVLTLIQNVALVVLLATTHRYLARVLDAHPRLSQLASGILYGSAAAVGMLMPFDFVPGVIYDGRSIIMALAGLFGGVPVALVAGVIAAGFRLLLGGVGAVAGVATIVTAGALGVVARAFSRGRPTSLSFLNLIGFGIIIHAVMLAAQVLILPPDMGSQVVRIVGPSLMTLFPLATAIAARMMIEQLEREQAKASLVDETRRLHLAMTAAEQGAWDHDLVSDSMSLSAEAARLMGLGDEPVSISSEKWVAAVHPDDQPRLAAALGARMAQHDSEVAVQLRLRLDDGPYRWYHFLGTACESDFDGVPTRTTGVITDITRTRLATEAVERRVVEAELLAAASGRLLGAHDYEAAFGVIRDFFAAAFPGAVVLINEVEPGGTTVKTRDIVGVDAKLIEWAEREIGWSIRGRRYPVTPEYQEVLLAKTMIQIDGGLAVITDGELSPAVSDILERALGVKEFWSIGISDSYVAYAGVHVLTHDPDTNIPRGVVESFANLCFVTLSRLFMQDLLVESEKRFRTLIEQTEQGVSVGHPDGRILVYNHAMEEISGYTKQEVISEGWFELVFRTPERKAEAMRVAAEALEGGFSYVEEEIVRKDGDTRWVSVATTPVELSGDTFNMSIFTDVTPRRHAEQALRESEERFRTLVEAAPVAIFVQTDCHFAYANQAALDLYGARSADDFNGQPVLDRFVKDSCEMARDHIAKLIEGCEPQTAMEMVHLRLDGSRIDVELSSAPIIYEGKPGAVVFVRDITEAKHTAAELEQYRAHLEELVEERTSDLEAANTELRRTAEEKMSFYSRMSHELRTPLNSIIGFSGVLQQRLSGPLTDEQAVEVEMISSAGHHLLSIISDLLDFSRAEAGRMRVESTVFAADELLEEVADFLRPIALEAGLELRLIAQPGVRIESDRMKIKRILLNLGGNAVKFTTAGYVELGLSFDDEQGVRFSVSDTGPGIQPELISGIFEPFGQGDLTGGAVIEGTGLGLTISRELAWLLGGEIDVTSEPGVGSTFYLVLPQATV